VDVTFDEQADLTVVCHLRGDLEQLTVTQFRERVGLVPPGRPMVLDLSGVPFIGSAGIGALIGTVRRARESGSHVTLCCPRPSVRRALCVVGLFRLVEIADTVPAGAHAVPAAPA